MSENIFLQMECYLANPTKALADRIKATSKKIYVDVLNDLQISKPKATAFGGDDIMPPIITKLDELAQEVWSASLSSRLVKIGDVKQEWEGNYIFRLSKKQQIALCQIKAELLKENDLFAHGFTLAYARFVERYRSDYHYCSDDEASLRGGNTQLFLKSEELRRGGYIKAADVLLSAHLKINQLCCSLNDKGVHQPQLINDIKLVLNVAKESSELQEHQPVLEFFINFLMTVSVFGLVYLSSTQDQRGTFWYNSNTAEQKLIKYEKIIDGIVTSAPDDKESGSGSPQL